MNIVQLIDKSLMKYEKWVIQNSGTLGEVESVIKYLSYIFTSQLENSNLLSELFYSLSKLLVFYNDQIIYKASVTNHRPTPYCSSLKKWLTVIGHCEVLIELGAQKIWGISGKWLIVFILQTFKNVLNDVKLENLGTLFSVQDLNLDIHIFGNVKPIPSIKFCRPKIPRFLKTFIIDPNVHSCIKNYSQIMFCFGYLACWKFFAYSC